MDRSRSSTPTWTCIRFMAGISSYGRKRRVADVVHHRFEVVANLAREAQSFDDSCRAQQGQDPDIVKRELAVDGARALDQAIKLFQVRHELSDVLASLPAVQRNRPGSCACAGDSDRAPQRLRIPPTQAADSAA